ncbi:polyamine ABC transporter ATP-binding protein [Anaerocolumna sedimenticola]|uniref:Spermidine/putrescine import ATP-binding protein PotA n=1 Tax=Anaerocolumna sedimenticola TaxID=2696063 RepID=A0A6P1TNJ9_9FIRM|nr:ABC transporter ATP-binding protein [Anaerocolumna sedimenticola]QHQ60938.1 polyamine ABC transporter ATP-binding protein [Anaerocolumna sedimenticola]
MGETILNLQKITKRFGDTKVLKGIDLTIEKGEFITFLGPSGCGKTTTLRIIAGLETPDTGKVILNGEDVTDTEPNKRDVNTVFQSYALFPHMDVASNIGYGLKLKKTSKETIKKKIEEVLELVQLQGFEKRKPSELSGGQKQRVAIARAIINNPKILLLDEPLGALDLQLRRQMQLELKKLQKKLGITFIYITHDQEEAINMSDRIVVMRDGIFEQTGTPDEVYNTPLTSYVARFVGNANVIEGKVSSIGEDRIVVTVGQENIAVKKSEKDYKVGDRITLAVRSENILVNDEMEYPITAKVTEKSFAGGLLRMVFQLENKEELVASRHGINYNLEIGDEAKIGWNMDNVVIVNN